MVTSRESPHINCSPHVMAGDKSAKSIFSGRKSSHFSQLWSHLQTDLSSSWRQYVQFQGIK